MPSSQGLMPLNPTSYAVLALCILNTVLSLLTPGLVFVIDT